MQIKRKSTIQRIVTVFALAATSLFGTMGMVGATTIGANISTATLTATGVTTLQAAASITSTSNPQLTVKYDDTNYWTEGADSTGLVSFDSVGSALAGAFTFSDPLKVATSTSVTALSVESLSSSNATTTLAVYQFGTGDIVNFYDGSTAAFTLKDGGRVGVASSTPSGLLSVEQGTEARSFVVGNTGSSTPSLVVLGVNGNGNVGVGTTTPTAKFAVDKGSGATTTLDFAKPCFRMTENKNGVETMVYYWPSSGSVNSSTLGGWATSTTSCF